MNSTKKILMIASTYPRWAGDSEPGFVHELARRLTGKFEVHVLAPHALKAEESENLDGVSIRRFRYAPSRFETLVHNGGIIGNLRKSRWKLLLLPLLGLAMASNLRRAIKSIRPDVVHAHWIIPQGAIAALVNLTLRHPVPFVVTSHGADLFALRGRFFQQLKTWTLRRASAVTVVSEAMLAPALELGVPPSRIHVEPMGVDLKGRFKPDKSTARRTNQILFVGRLVEKKGLKHLLAAMPLVLRDFPNANLKVIGFGPELEDRKRQCAELNIEASVQFMGPMAQSELPKHYREATIFVAPFVEAEGGDQEGLGLVTIEALGCGCQAIISSVPATLGLAQRSSGVSTVPPGDHIALAKRIIEKLRAEPPPVITGIEHFDWESRANAYAGILESVASTPHP